MATTAATPSTSRHQNVYPGTPSSEKRRLKGLWSRNEWWCNCSPRAKAVSRTVTRDTPNKGKWFWACPLPPPDGCGFFLLFEDARRREDGLSGEGAGANLANTPSKVPSLTQTRLTDIGFELLGDRRQSDPGTTQAEDEDGEKEIANLDQPMSSSLPEMGASSSEDKGKGKAVATGDASYEPLTPGPSTGVKRTYDVFADDDFDDMGSDEERELADMTDRSVEKFVRAQAYNQDDGKAEDGEDDGLATSSRPVARTLFPRAESAKRTKSVSFEEPEPEPQPQSPTPHARGAQSSPPSTMQTSPPSSMDAPPTVPSSAMTPTQQNDDEDLDGSYNDTTEQVMSLLQNQSVEPSVLQSVHSLLLTSARRTKGIAMGRDFARTAVNEKKVKIARLQERIAALENKEQSLNGQITHIKASLMKMYEDN